MRNPLLFFSDLLKQPTWVPAWVAWLSLINLASLAFWDQHPAPLIFLTFMASAMLMMALYSHFGYQKILGFGHFLWIPLVVYILIQVPQHDGLFQAYLLVLAISIAVSLIFDIYDVWQFFNRRKAS